ncbi:amidase domain-containing protein [Clostridium sardiniense]|uniref:Amidase domain-containing protein n=1 Tax=Clostridium sardiniense TaxID=29369 RepID=A0ABS7L3D3_CLOSR|nr:amidase domain-containing protein [Clostridium sardiniense]MBY0757452.1 amidase domain-containing protein [Clostridium sardiniense]MDQ0462205.1 hypothetical protein [Clostridium sardiniense]
MYNIIMSKKSSVKTTIKQFLNAIFSNNNFKQLISNDKLNELLDLKIKYFTLYNKKSSLPILDSYSKIKYDFIKEVDENYSLVKFSVYSIFDIDGNSFNSITTSTYISLLKKISDKWFIDYISDIESLKDTVNYKDPKTFILFYNTLLDNEIDKYNSLLLNFNTLNINIKSTVAASSVLKKTSYSKSKAVEYAEKYALNYNKEYIDFDKNGGDCTNFVSQTIHYAGIKTSSTWKPYSNPWVRVNELRNYLIYNHLAFETTNIDQNCVGSIIQFFSPIKNTWSHSGIITYNTGNTCLYCYHSYDKLNYPLSYVYPNIYPKIRIVVPY